MTHPEFNKRYDAILAKCRDAKARAGVAYNTSSAADFIAAYRAANATYEEEIAKLRASI